jgi:hypothetical protein
MSSSKVPAPADNAETTVATDDPVALADAQLNQVAAGVAPAVGITPANLPLAVAAAVDVAAAVKIIRGPITVGLLPPLQLPTI